MSVALFMPEVKPALRIFDPYTPERAQKAYELAYGYGLGNVNAWPLLPGYGEIYAPEINAGLADGLLDRGNWVADFYAALDRHTVADECWLLGEELGAEGVDAEINSPDADEQAAFDAGLDWGDNRLWEEDPSYAAYVRGRRLARLRACNSPFGVR